MSGIEGHEAGLRPKGIKFIMTEHKSFRISGFSIRDIPWAVAAYFILSLLSIGLGVFLESLPEFWSGFLSGAGLALVGAFLLLGPRTRKIDVAALPQPSEKVRAKCDDPNCSLVEAVKAYREETGLGLSEAKAVVESYRASKRRLAKNDTMT
jgi:hypothetical protein